MRLNGEKSGTQALPVKKTEKKKEEECVSIKWRKKYSIELITHNKPFLSS